MKKIEYLIISVMCIFLLGACGKEKPSAAPEEPAVTEEVNIYEEVDALIENGDYESAFQILSSMDDTAETERRKNEVSNLIQAEQLKAYSGKWISAANLNEYYQFNEGTGIFNSEQEDSAFSFTAGEDGVELTGTESISLALSVGEDGVRILQTSDGNIFFNQNDADSLPDSEKVSITADNWEEYFEIRKDRFAESSKADGQLAYLCEIMYMAPREEYADRISIYDSFSVTFDVEYDETVRFAIVDKMAHEYTMKKEDMFTCYPRTERSSVFDNGAFSRVKNGTLEWKDGFDNPNLRWNDENYGWHYRAAENIKVINVRGEIFLTD